jgi:hypothetical protein
MPVPHLWRCWLIAGALAVVPALAFAEGAKPPELRYSGPEDLKGAEVAAFEFLQWEPGQEAFVASHNTNLRDRASTQGAVLAALPMAARVKILDAEGGPANVAGKIDRWYQVEVAEPGPAQGKRGFLFGMVLTPYAFKLDLDQDGEAEIITAAFTQDFLVRLRIREPKVDQPEHVALDVRPAGGAYISRQGGLARVRVLPPATAGVGLIEVFVHVEACADYATHWVSYQVPGRKPGVLGEAKLALTQGGLSDPPVHASYEVSFDPKLPGATVQRKVTEEDAQGKVTEERKTLRFKLQDGVFVELR